MPHVEPADGNVEGAALQRPPGPQHHPMPRAGGGQRRLRRRDAAADHQHGGWPAVAAAPPGDLLPQGASPLGQQLLRVEHAPAGRRGGGEQRRKRRRDAPRPDGAGGEDQRGRLDLPKLVRLPGRAVLHAEGRAAAAAAAARPGNAGGGPAEPLVRQFCLERGAKVAEEGTRRQRLEQRRAARVRVLGTVVCGRHPLHRDGRRFELGGPALPDRKLDERSRLKGRGVDIRGRAQPVNLERAEAAVPRVEKVRARVDHSDGASHGTLAIATDQCSKTRQGMRPAADNDHGAPQDGPGSLRRHFNLRSSSWPAAPGLSLEV
mmetsp:Transcript_27769/g.83009  ORF Transcript_27769/g.83009 Transcript_27769/m.83009 type:complete len:319 (-) Transcript_27769:42-998(-)